MHDNFAMACSLQIYGGIFLPQKGKINHVNLQENYINMQDKYVVVQDNYVDMLLESLIFV